MVYLLTTPPKNYVLAPARLFWQMWPFAFSLEMLTLVFFWRLRKIQPTATVTALLIHQLNKSRIGHLNQREPALLPLAPGCIDHKSYQSLYFVPFNPMSVDLVYTSNTFCPPHESD
jgi:hypothetical protein